MGIETIFIGGSALLSAYSSSRAADNQADAARNAAEAQVKANADNIAFQKWLYGEQTAQNKPWYDAGIAALSKLNVGLGTAPKVETADAIKQRLTSQYTKPFVVNNGNWRTDAIVPTLLRAGMRPDVISNPDGTFSQIDQAGLDAAVAAELQKQQSEYNTAINSPGYGTAFDPGKLDTSAIKDPGAFDGSTVNLFADPGYQFRMSEGQKALDRSAAARGLTQSGAQQKATLNYAQGLGSQEYGNAYNRAFQQYGTQVDQYGRQVNALATDYNANANRLQNQFGNLLSISNAGQNAANQNNNAATNSGAQISNSLQNNGNALANMYTAQGNAAAAGAAGIATSANQGIQNYLSNSYLSKLQPNYLGANNQLNNLLSTSTNY